MFSPVVAAALICALIHTLHPVIAQNLGKPALRPDLSYLNGPFWQHLTPTHATWDQWGSGWIPQACLTEVDRDQKCNVADVQVFNVHYDDCSTAWVMCRCNNAQMSISQMVDAFGRLPVRYRQWVRHVVAFSDTARHAYAVNGEIVFFKDSYVPTIWVHESSHIVDSFAIPVNGASYSSSQTWLNTINEDPKVPDPYSNVSPAEDFAQVANIAMFDKIVPNGFGSVEPNWNDVFHQYATVQWVLGNSLFQGGTCTRRWADSTIVSMGLRTAAGKVANKPVYMPKNRNATGLDPAIVTENPNMKIIRDDHH